jgi:hypothetical protein
LKLSQKRECSLAGGGFPKADLASPIAMPLSEFVTIRLIKVVYIIYILMVRIWLELIIVVFRIAENTYLLVKINSPLRMRRFHSCHSPPCIRTGNKKAGPCSISRAGHSVFSSFPLDEFFRRLSGCRKNSLRSPRMGDQNQEWFCMPFSTPCSCSNLRGPGGRFVGVYAC